VNGRRRIWLDRAIGETRALVALDGRPERLLIEREDGMAPVHRLGARVRGRLTRIERGSGLAFVDLGAAPDAVLPLSQARDLAEGATVEVEITAEPRADKGPSARLVGKGQGVPGLVSAAPTLEARLESSAPGAPLVEGDEARDRIDAGVDEALALQTRLPGGGLVTVEPTRALVAVDVDFADQADPDARRAVRKLNLKAVHEAARLLRLSGLGGLVVIDLIGTGHDGEALRAAAEEAFAPDQPGVAFGRVSKFGTFELARPWRERPLREVLCGPDGRLTPLSAALALLRMIERVGRADPGGRISARCAQDVAEAAAPYTARLVERIGPRFQIVPELAVDRSSPDISVL
jgi:Ribonuclease G/E